MISSYLILVSIVVSIPACHAGDRGSIPRRGDFLFLFNSYQKKKKNLRFFPHMMVNLFHVSLQPLLLL